MVKCLGQGGWRGGRRGQARRVGMVGRLLQGLDQVVSVLWIYGPEGTFAYALKETEEERGENERVVTGNVTRSLTAHRKHGAETPERKAQSSDPTCTHRPVFCWEITLGGMRIIASPLPSRSTFSFPLCRKKKIKNSG